MSKNDEKQLSALFDAIIEWAVSKGAKNINELDGCWTGKTEKDDVFPQITVTFNGHETEVDGVPPISARLTLEDYFPGIIGVIGPFDGFLLGSPVKGENEDGLIRHFKEQVQR